MPEGLVIQHGANRYLVEESTGVGEEGIGPGTASGGEPPVWACVVAGRLRKGRRDQVRVAVIGDRVRFSASAGAEDRHGMIEEILPRRNRISRPAPSGGQRRSLEQVVMANLDRLWVIASLDQPPLNLAIVDRILAAAHHQGVDAGLVLNKLDLVDPVDIEPVERLYAGLGYPVHACSAIDGRGIDGLRDAFEGALGVFVGLSGVGKSSLLSALQPGLEIRVASVGEKSGQGRHTTTVSRLYRLDNGGHLADTPGMREFGLWAMAKLELGECFVEFDPLAPNCRFRDCIHKAEPGCAVSAGVESGDVDPGRYRRYLALLGELPDRLDGWRDRPHPPKE